ncbi:TPA: hypothetical protein ENX78_06385 [Candidatus Poribacteria bacterium]|nr:hypothetical protein [Candidatus Poribacteria bacterium]
MKDGAQYRVQYTSLVKLIIIFLILYCYLSFFFKKPDMDITAINHDDTFTLAEKFAPRLHLNGKEFFGLKDLFVVFHPDKPVIAYHLFWEDDIDFPNDGQPNDHEIIWVQYSHDKSKVISLWTYWHGKILEKRFSNKEVVKNPDVYIQWGKHGSLPQKWDQGFSIRPGMEIYIHYFLCRYIHKHNRSVLSTNWPERFDGNFRDYLTFSNILELNKLISKEKILVCIDSNNKIRILFKENFSYKIEWPT